MIEETLGNLGLNEKEVKIYLALLPLGNAPASALARRTNIPRSTTKFTCEQLVKKGLVMEATKGNASIYSAEPPDKILVLLDHQKKEITEREIEVGQIISDLKQIYSPETILPKVRYYTNHDDLIQLYMEVLDYLDKGDDLPSFVANPLSIKSDLHNASKILAEFREKRVEKKIFNRILAPKNHASKLVPDDKKYFRETRMVDVSLASVQGAECFFVKDRIYSFVLQGYNVFALMVEQKHIAEIYRAIFEVAWNNAKKPLKN